MKRMHAEQLELVAFVIIALTLGQKENECHDKDDDDMKKNYIWLDDWQRKQSHLASNSRISLTILSVFSNETAFDLEEERNDANKMRAAYELSVEDVNAHQNAFPFFYLRSETYGKGDVMRYEVLREIQGSLKNKRPVAMIDAVSSSFSMTIALLTQEKNVLHISTTAASSFLSKHSFFPSSLRMQPSALYFVEPVFQLLKTLAPNKIAIIYDRVLYSDVVRTNFRNKLAEVEISVWEEPITVYFQDHKKFFNELKMSSILIVVGLVDKVEKKDVLCAAIKLPVPAGSVTWIFPELLIQNKAYSPAGQLCSDKEINKTLEESFFTSSDKAARQDIVGISGQSVVDFTQRLAISLGQNIVMLTREPQVYDSVWALALAINKTLQGLPPASSSDFSASQLMTVLRSVSFMGLRGPVGMQETGEPKTIVLVAQTLKNREVVVGCYNPFKNNTNQSGLIMLNGFVWPKNLPKKSSRRNAFAQLSGPLYICFCLLAFLGLMLCCALLTFNVVRRKAVSTKTSTPLLQNLTALGCACGYSCMFIKYTSGEHKAAGCTAFTILLSLGVSLVLGSLLAMAWKAHLLFRKSTEERPVLIPEWRLVSFVLLFAIVQILASIVWIYADPISANLSSRCSLDANYRHPDENVNLYRCEGFCTSSHHLIRLFVSCVIFVAVEVLTLFLSWEASRIVQLTDCNPLTACACNNLGLSLIGGIAFSILKKGMNQQYATFSTIIIFAATVNLCLIFAPQVRLFCEQRKKNKNPTQAPASN